MLDSATTMLDGAQTSAPSPRDPVAAAPAGSARVAADRAYHALRAQAELDMAARAAEPAAARVHLHLYALHLERSRIGQV